jgi:hypothetical protein
MERVMGADFSAVRVHTDAAANALAQKLNARAFTVGTDIFFAAGAYNPASNDGQLLIAHEAAHVIQQRAAVQVGPADGAAVGSSSADVQRKSGKWGAVKAAVADGSLFDAQADTGGGRAKIADEDEADEVELQEENETGADGNDVLDENGENVKKDATAIGFDLDKRRAAAKTNQVDGVESFGIDKDGIDAGGIELADGWTGDFRLGPNQQKAEFAAPTELHIPPPDGFELDLANVKVPLGPGFGLDIVAGLEGGLEMSNIALALERAASKTDVQKIDRFKVSGGGDLAANFGVKVEVAMWGGVPLVAAVRAGLRAKAEAEAKLEFEVGGMLDLYRTVPVKGEKSQVTGKQGEIYFNIGGAGDLSAALSAFLGFELFTVKGDLYELVFVEAPIATLDAGARFGVKFGGGQKREFYKEPLGTDYVNFEWLFGKLWKARKLDAAKNAATSTKADVAALRDLQGREDVDYYIGMLNLFGDEMHVANGELQLLLNEEDTLQKLIESGTADIDKLQNEINTTLAQKNAATKAKRWAITNFIKGDIPELKSARKQCEAMKKTLASNQKKVTDLQGKKRAAQDKFVQSVDPLKIDDLIKQAQAKADDTYKANWKTFSAEFDAAHKASVERKTKIQEEITKQDELIEGIRQRLVLAEASPETISVDDLRTQLGKAQGQRTYLIAQLAKVRREADAGAQEQLKLLTGIGVAQPNASGGKNADKFAALVGQMKGK